MSVFLHFISFHFVSVFICFWNACSFAHANAMHIRLLGWLLNGIESIFAFWIYFFAPAQNCFLFRLTKKSRVQKNFMKFRLLFCHHHHSFVIAVVSFYQFDIFWSLRILFCSLLIVFRLKNDNSIIRGIASNIHPNTNTAVNPLRYIWRSSWFIHWKIGLFIRKQ